MKLLDSRPHRPFSSVLGVFATILTTTGALHRPVRGPAGHSAHPHHRTRTMAAAASLNYPAPLVYPASKAPTAAIFMMHGLGDSAYGWASISEEIQPALPHANLVFPNAPTRPITLNYGMAMPGWYDIASLDGINANEDREGLEESQRYIQSLVQKQIDSGIPSNRIVIAGFSQGAAVALMMLRSNTTFAGIAALSGYLPLSNLEPVVSEANKNTPIATFHGNADQVVFYKYGADTAKLLKERGLNVDFKTYQGMGHTARGDELADFLAFLQHTLPSAQ